MKTPIITTIWITVALIVSSACASPAAPAPAAITPAAPAPAAITPAAPAPAAITPAAPAPAAITPAAPAPAPGQGAFVVSELKLDWEMVLPGGNVTARVKITNTGRERGTYKVVLKLNGKTVKTQDVILNGGDSQNVVLTFAVEELGEYNVTVDQLTAKLFVQTHVPE